MSARLWTLEGGAFVEGGSVPPTDRGFRYGMSLFETIAVWRGRMLFAGEHLHSLDRAARAAGFWEASRAEHLGEGLCRSGLNFGSGNGMLRIYVTAGDGAPTVPVDAPRVFGIYEEAHFPTLEEAGRGWRIMTAEGCVPPDGPAKSGAYWPRIRAFGQARANGFDEALLFTAAGELVSAAMANVFLVADGVCHTPGPAHGAREGIVRAWVAQRAKVVERILTPKDVRAAQECFLTNSRIGIMPVVEIDGRRLPAPEIGRRLAAQYHDEVLGR